MTLAMKVQLDSLARVKKMIDKMVTDLVKEGEDEIKQRDFCVDQKNTEALQKDSKMQEKAALTTKISDLELTISEAGDAIAATKAEIAESQAQLKTARETRDKEKEDFQMTIGDQRATQKLLAQAMNVLKSFYAKKAKAVLLTQTKASTRQTPAYETNAG